MRKSMKRSIDWYQKFLISRLDRFYGEAVKMPENPEKQRFTFFAFLPPYIGVSGSLVSRKRKISMRSIDWYQKFLMSHLVARYSAVFVFYVVKIDFLKLNFTPKALIENFWEALGLGIEPFLCLTPPR